jgi:N-acetylneuraminate synthase/N,N'-diacetyllegionaminate synthase
MNKVIIIAEAGVNHNGDIQVAKKLIDVAVDAGVDYVKFQTFKADSLVSKSAKKSRISER